MSEWGDKWLQRVAEVLKDYTLLEIAFNIMVINSAVMDDEARQRLILSRFKDVLHRRFKDGKK